jgi:outer membrane protein TolC
LRPQLSASASYDRALASEFEGLFDTTSTGSSDLSGFEDLPFGRKNTWRATLAFSQNLYSGGRNGAQVAVASVGHETAQLGLTTTRAELLFEVTQAYYDAVLSERLVTIALATLDQASATLRQTEAGFSAGTQPEFEVLRARVARDNQLPTLIRQRVNRDISFLRLKRLLDLPANVDLQLADALGEEALPPPPVFAERVAAVEQMFRADDLVSASLATTAALPERTAVAQAAANVRLREASLKLTEAQRMPSLSLNSTYSRLAYPNDALPHFDRSNWSLGVSVSVPVLTGGRQRGDEQVARAELDQSRLQRQQTEELAALDTRSTWAALLAVGSTAGTAQQADRAYTSPTSATRPVCPHSSSWLTPGCCCGRPRRTARRRRAICRSLGHVWRCCPTCQSARVSTSGPPLRAPRCKRLKDRCSRRVAASSGMRPCRDSNHRQELNEDDR